MKYEYRLHLVFRFCCAALSNLHICHFKWLTWPLLLQSITKRQGIIDITWLEDIKSAIKCDLPTCIGYDMTCMHARWLFKLPGKLDTNSRTAILDLCQILQLLIWIEFINRSDQVNSHFFSMRFKFDNRLEEFHQIADLMEGSNVWIR